MNRQKSSSELRSIENIQKSRSKKRKQYFNKKNVESDENSFSTSAKKMKMLKDAVPQDNYIEYRILNFISVFAAISNFVKCKVCNGDVKFQTASARGLGFKIVLICNTCAPTSIPSCSSVEHSYEINRRFIFTMRVLGHGLKDCQKFCGLMDMPEFFTRSTYDIIISNILNCVKEVSNIFFKNAVNEEKAETSKKKNIEGTNDLTVSVNDTWKKCGVASLNGVSSIIGYYTGKVLDIVVKRSCCQACEFWERKQDTAEYEEWVKTHSNNCSVNRKMKVGAITKMFTRSQDKYGVKYINYIGDVDSETYISVINSAPYGDDTLIIKKECIKHMKKKIGHRLRECKKKMNELGEEGKLTSKMIDKLTDHYSLAIQENCDSVNEMRNAIWATYFHYSSTDESPQHDKCPTGVESWCTWQRASANGELGSYKHDYESLPRGVLDAIKPIYEDLSKEELLERCIGGLDQNKSYNQMIWKISPKIILSGLEIVKLAAHISACVFNEGSTALLQIFESIGVHSGPNAHRYVAKEDAIQIKMTSAHL